MLPAILRGLRDDDDDVRAVAAEALLPVVELAVSLHFDSVCGLVCNVRVCVRVCVCVC